MFGLPTKTIVAIHKDGTREDIMCTDVITVEGLISEIAWLIRDMIKHDNTEFRNWESFEYMNGTECISKVDMKQIIL